MSQTWNPAGATLVRIEENEPTRGDAQPSEFERFEDLTQKLLHVPKSEVDEKRKKSG